MMTFVLAVEARKSYACIQLIGRNDSEGVRRKRREIGAGRGARLVGAIRTIAVIVI